MSKNWAICIGINEYHYLKPLKCAVNDAAALRDFFQDEVKFDQVYYFSDDSPDIETPNGLIRSKPTRNNLRYFFRKRFPQRPLNDGDNVWLFFAGHGVLHGGNDYLMPIDVDPGDVENTALKLSDITAHLRDWGADNTVLLLDACREDGSRSGTGIGTETQPGIVTFYSCSPRQSSFEIEALQQGGFTHALLEGFRLQGANSCATVQRLDQFLRHQVPRLSERYQKPVQTPYTSVEPLSKNCLILLPDQARLEDVQALKNAAFRAENRNQLDVAQRLWIRVLAVFRVDQDAIEALQRLARQQVQQSLKIDSEPETTGIRSVNAELREATPIHRMTTSLSNQQSLPTFDFEVVTVDSRGEVAKRVGCTAEYFREDLGQDTYIDLVLVPGGKFMMGSSDTEGNDDARPQHSVAVSSFWMSKYPITQSQWRAVAALPEIGLELISNPSGFQGNNHPVEQVSWDDAAEFCKRLSSATGRNYRLPSEAEWEYACRANTVSLFHYGDVLTPQLARCKSNAFTALFMPMFSGKTSPVGSFTPNHFGLYDMHGNVWEWCLDNVHLKSGGFGMSYKNAPVDGSAWLTGDASVKIVRGGSWSFNPPCCHSSYRWQFMRTGKANHVGFRIVCSD